MGNAGLNAMNYLPIFIFGGIFLAAGFLLCRSRSIFSGRTRNQMDRNFGLAGRAASEASSPQAYGLVAIAFMGIGALALGLGLMFALWPLLVAA